MQTVVETLNSFTRKLKLEISREDLLPLQDKLFKNYQRQTAIPGFRPGKAPINIVRQRYKDQMKQDLIEEALREFYGKALDETKINPVSEGRMTSFTFNDIDQGMQFEFELEVEPEIELQKFKGLKVEKDLVEISDQMVNDALERLREQYATVKEVEEAKTGHYLHFDAQELDKGDFPIVGHKYENLQVKLGSGKFDSEIENQLEGIKLGDKRIVRKEMPPANPKDKQPQRSSLEIQVKKIEEREFPELNDDFVKNLNDESLVTLPQLRSRIQENMQLDFQYRSEENLQSRLIDELLKENPFEVWGTGHQGRDFVHIDDILDCIEVAMEKIHDGTAINIGMGKLTSFLELIQIFCGFAGYTPEIKPLLDKPVGVHSRYCNMDWVKENLGWEPKISIEEGMKRVYDAVLERESKVKNVK